MSAAGWYRALLAGLAIACVAGCATAPSSSPSPPSQGAPATQRDSASQPARKVDRNLSGYPLAFKQGYVEGCDSAASGTRRRDEGRYKGDGQYMLGWNDGYSVCRR